jgi:hypothetical protein
MSGKPPSVLLLPRRRADVERPGPRFAATARLIPEDLFGDVSRKSIL